MIYASGKIFLKSDMGFVFQKSYTESLSKKWYVASTLPIYTHSQAPHREQHADMQKADQKGAGLQAAESVGWGYETHFRQSA